MKIFKTRMNDLTKNMYMRQSIIEKSSQKILLSSLKGQRAWCVVNLGTYSGLASISLLFENPFDYNKTGDCYKGKFVFYSRVYLPEMTLESSPNSELYNRAIEAGDLVTTPGNVTDFDYIISELLQLKKLFKIETVYVDKWNSAIFVSKANQVGLKVEGISFGPKSILGLKKFRSLLENNRFIIDDNIVTKWNFNNVVTELYAPYMPKKKNKDQEITILISMICAFSQWLSEFKGRQYLETPLDKIQNIFKWLILKIKR